MTQKTSVSAIEVVRVLDQFKWGLIDAGLDVLLSDEQALKIARVTAGVPGVKVPKDAKHIQTGIFKDIKGSTKQAKAENKKNKKAKASKAIAIAETSSVKRRLKPVEKPVDLAGLSEVGKQVLDAAKQRGTVFTAAEIAEILGVKSVYLSAALANLNSRGAIKKAAEGTSRTPTSWVAT